MKRSLGMRLKKQKYRMKSRGQKMAASRVKRRGGGQLSELKFVDKQLASYAATGSTGMWIQSNAFWQANGIVPATAGIVPLNGIATGTGATNRIGKKIFMKTLQIRGYIDRSGMLSTATDQLGDFSAHNLRLVIIYDKQPNVTNACPSGALIFKQDQVDALRLLDNADRFAVLLDETFVVGPPAIIYGGALGTVTASSGGTANGACWFERFIKINLPTTYSEAGANTIDNINTGALHVYTAWNGYNISTVPAGVFNFRLRYVDA